MHPVLDGNGDLKQVFSLGAGSSGDPLRLVMQDYRSALVDAGLVYGMASRLTLANNATLDMLLVTPATPAHIELLTMECSTTSAPVYIDLYEGTIVSANGTAVTNIRNYNRQSNRANGLAIYQGATVTDTGISVDAMLLAGDKTIGGGNGQDGRFILKPSEKYLVRVQNVSGASATLGFRLVFGED
jgi:hypothetical protein